MGVFFWTNSVALVEDIPLEAEYKSRDELVRDMDAGFQQVGTDSNILSILMPTLSMVYKSHLIRATLETIDFLEIF